MPLAANILAVKIPAQDPACPHNVARTLMNIAAGRYRSIPASVSDECADLIRSMLVVDPSARPSLEAILAQPWLAAAAADTADSASDDEPAGMDMTEGVTEPPVAGSTAMDLDAPAALHSSARPAAQDASRQLAGRAAPVGLAQQQLVEAASGASPCGIGGHEAAVSDRRLSVSESAELPASIGAFPVEERRTFSFHMGGPREGGKAVPATPRIASLAGTAGFAAAAGATAGSKAPAQQGPPSRGGGAPEEATRSRFGLSAFLCGFLWG